MSTVMAITLFICTDSKTGKISKCVFNQHLKLCKDIALPFSHNSTEIIFVFSTDKCLYNTYWEERKTQ